MRGVRIVGREYVARGISFDFKVDPASALSARERDIAAQIARGMTAKEIAYEDGRASSTIDNLVRRICAKLGARGRCELILLFAPDGALAHDHDAPLSGTFRRDVVAPARRLTAMTEAERDVAIHAFCGMDTRRISQVRGVSPHTVSTQLRAAFRRLRVSSRSDLCALLLGGAPTLHVAEDGRVPQPAVGKALSLLTPRRPFVRNAW